MSFTYLLGLTDGGGTVPPELGVASRLVQRGHRVLILGEDSTAEQVEAAGAVFLPWQQGPNRPDHSAEHTAYRDWETKDPLGLARGMAEHMIAGPAAGQAADVSAVIAQERPDLVLASFVSFGTMIAAEAHGVPFDVLMPNIYTLPAPGMPPMGLGLRPATSILGRMRDQFFGALSMRILDRYTLSSLNEVRRTHHLGPLTHTWDQVYRARRQLVLTSPAFDFPAQVPATVRYVGPVLDDPSWAADEHWRPPPGRHPLVLVAFSSTFQDQADCLQRIIQALGGLPVRGLVTTGSALEPGLLRPSANVTVVGSAPHGPVMAQAALIITHGGHGTVMKALAADLPLVVLPHGRDQADNAVRVSMRGAGRTVPRSASNSKIAAAVRDVIDNAGYARAAAVLGAAVRRDTAGETLMTELESLPAGRGS